MKGFVSIPVVCLCYVWFYLLVRPNQLHNTPHSAKRNTKTYNTRDSPVVTHPSTNLAITGLSMGERTGSRVFLCLWSYVICFSLDGIIMGVLSIGVEERNMIVRCGFTDELLSLWLVCHSKPERPGDELISQSRLVDASTSVSKTSYLDPSHLYQPTLQSRG
jgi:hypothetical protein